MKLSVSTAVKCSIGVSPGPSPLAYCQYRAFTSCYLINLHVGCYRLFLFLCSSYSLAYRDVRVEGSAIRAGSRT